MKLIKHESYRKYGNKIIYFIYKAKTNLLSRFEQNKKVSKTIWQGTGIH